MRSVLVSQMISAVVSGGLLPVWVAALSVTAVPATAMADLAGGEAKFLAGEYADAKRALKAPKAGERDSARLLLAQVEAVTGNEVGAVKILVALSKSRKPALKNDASVALAEIYRSQGKVAQALALTEATLKRDTKHFRARWQKALALRELGKMKEAKAEHQWFTDQWDAGQIDASKPAEMFYLAEAARYRGEFEFANDVFRDVIDRDGKHLRANLEWGHMFLTKYADANAEESFDEVLKINPNHPGAHAGKAQVKVSNAYDVAGSLRHINLALAVNKHHVPSLLVRASIEIDQNKWAAAKKTLAQALAVNPRSLEALSMRATIFWLRDDRRAYQAEKRKVLAANPAFAELFHIVARSAVREHRYVDAIELEKEAVKIDPEYFEAMQAIGTGYLRVGNEKQGVDWLRKAWKGDEYNTRTFNTLELFDEHIPRGYSFSRTKNFKIRYHNEEKAILSRYLSPLLEKAYADMVARYKFVPKTPLVIELYQDPDHYSVRTVGLPNLGALGVCFGQVITAMSPSVGDINYAMVLWHELSHVFAIQLSKSRVPRWYTEGLSEYETVLARPEWRRENDADVWAAMQEGTLPSVAELNYGFMKPSMKQVIVAYHLSSITIEYIARNYGFEKIVLGLKLFGQGLETPEVVAKITGKSVADFDKEFRVYLTERLRPYRGTLHIPEQGYDDLKKLEIAKDAKPKLAKSHADLALGYFYDGNAAKAKLAADQALKLEPKNKVALYISAEVATRGGDTDNAKKLYEQLIRAGGDGFDVRSRLAAIAIRAGETAAAIKHLCTAKRLDPERSYPYQALSELFTKEKRTEEALRELETFVMIEQMQYSPVKKLVTEYAAIKRWDKVTSYGRLAVEINPFDVDLLTMLGRANLEVGKPKDSLFHFDSALVVEPPLGRPAIAHIGRAKALKALGKKAAAKTALEKALTLEPENAEALELKTKL